MQGVDSLLAWMVLGPVYIVVSRCLNKNKGSLPLDLGDSGPLRGYAAPLSLGNCLRDLTYVGPTTRIRGSEREHVESALSHELYRVI